MTEVLPFRDGEAVFAHLVRAYGGQPVANVIVVPLEGGGASRVDAIERHGEIWIRCVTEIGPQDEIDPEWALAHNAGTTATSLQTAGNDCTVMWCLPVAWLTPDRLARLLDEGRAERATIREEFGVEDAEEDDEDDDEDEDEEEEEDLGDD